MRRKFKILFVFLLAPQAALFAQTDSSLKASKLSKLSLEELMNVEITTVSRKQEKVREAPATVYVITQDEIRKRGYVHLKDVLRDLPGMETIENYIAGVGTLVPVRGVIGNNKIVVLVNGRRVNPPGGEEMNLTSDFNILQAKQIEIIYGLGAIMYGQDAISAVINVITEQPAKPIKVDVMAKGGMFNHKEGVVAISGRIPYSGNDFVTVSSSFSYTDAELSNLAKEYPDYWERSYGKIIRNAGLSAEPKRFNKGMNGFLKIESNTSAIQVWHRECVRNTAEGGAAGLLAFTDQSKHHDRTTVITANNDFKFTDKLQLSSSTSYNRYEIDRTTLYVSPVRDTALKHNYAYAIGNGLRLQERLIYNVSKKLSLRGGFLAAFYDVLPRATFRESIDQDIDIVSQADLVTYYTRKNDSSSKVEIHTANNINYYNFGSYIESNLKLSEKLNAILGVRMDIDSRFAELPLSPRVALIYNPNTNFSFKYIYNRGYLAPAPFFTYSVFDVGTRINTSNPDLKPEKASSNELNFNYANKNLTLGTAFYYNLQENLIFLGDASSVKANVVQDTVWTDIEGRNPKKLTRQVNSGNSRAFGTDLFAKFNFKKIAGWASFSYVNFERDLGTEKTGLNKISPINVRLGLSLMPVQKLVITPSIIYRTTPDNFTNTFGMDKEIQDPYEVNMFISYAPVKSITLFIDGRNITNHKYALKGNTSPAPQEPFRIMGGIRFITGS
jgi:outer membrane receptor for ferrienterochelin and colicin